VFQPPRFWLSSWDSQNIQFDLHSIGIIALDALRAQ